jgi:hypothetical protein
MSNLEAESGSYLQKGTARKYLLTHGRAALAYLKKHRMKGLCTSCPRIAFNGKGAVFPMDLPIRPTL